MGYWLEKFTKEIERVKEDLACSLIPIEPT